MMMTYLFSLFLLIGTIQAKTVEVAICDSINYTYIDANDDGVFDSLMIIKGQDTTIQMLKKVLRKPNKIDYNQASFDVHLLNYNNTFNDAYFQIRLLLNGKVIGFYEHIMGRNELQYFEVGQ